MVSKLLDLRKMHDLQILNGRTAGDRHGLFNFHDTMQGASAIGIAAASDTMHTDQIVCRRTPVRHLKTL